MRHCQFLGLLFVLIVSLALANGSVLAASNELQIEKVEVQFVHLSPVVLLIAGEKAITIFVDPTVAGSIHGALTGEKFPRPLSHDLMQTILKTYEVQLERVFISLRGGVFYGTLTLSQGGQKRVFDSRSSDAIALAVHFHSPIFIERDLMDSAGKVMREGSEKNKDIEL